MSEKTELFLDKTNEQSYTKSIRFDIFFTLFFIIINKKVLHLLIINTFIKHESWIAGKTNLDVIVHGNNNKSLLNNVKRMQKDVP